MNCQEFDELRRLRNIMIKRGQSLQKYAAVERLEILGPDRIPELIDGIEKLVEELGDRLRQEYQHEDHMSGGTDRTYRQFLDEEVNLPDWIKETIG